MMISDEENTSYIDIEAQSGGAIQGNHHLSSANRDIPSGSNLEKIKDLLFGTQVREYEKRFNHLEERLSVECANLREETHRRFDVIEQYIHQQIESLNTALRTEQNQRDEAIRGLDENLKTIARLLEKKVTQLDEQTAQQQRELRQQLLEQAKTLNDEIQQRYQEVLATSERRVQELRAEKADRGALASLLREMAMHLNNQPQLPGGLSSGS